MYDNYQELIADIIAKYPNNSSREISETDVRQVSTDTADFFYRRILDFYKAVRTNDANYAVEFQSISGMNDIQDSIIVCDSISVDRTMTFPSAVRPGNKLLIYVRATNDHVWNTNITFINVNGTASQLREGGNLIIWTEIFPQPIIMYFNDGITSSSLIVVENDDPIESGDINNEFLNTNYPLSFQYPLNVIIRFNNLTDMPSNIGESKRLDGSTWYTSLTSYKNQ